MHTSRGQKWYFVRIRWVTSSDSLALTFGCANLRCARILHCQLQLLHHPTHRGYRLVGVDSMEMNEKKTDFASVGTREAGKFADV